MSQPFHLMKSEVGEVRPSQMLTTFGIGSIVDLPNTSMLVMGIDDWPVTHSGEIEEKRLLESVQSLLGDSVKRLLTAPRSQESASNETNWFDEARHIGVPVAPFPRWLVCTKCRLLAPISSGLFAPKVQAYRTDKTRYVHNCSTQGKPPIAIPARFLVTCEHGHLDDFPWMEFVHDGLKCNGNLYLKEVGVSGEAADVEVRCGGCDSHRRIGHAFGPNNSRILPPCRGRRPHLRDFDPNGCDQAHVKPILQGASNLWFPVLVSVLSLPQATDELGALVEANWLVLDKAINLDIVKAFRLIGSLKDFAKYSDEQVWAAVEKKRGGPIEVFTDPDKLKWPEWKVFSNPKQAKESHNFRLVEVPPPPRFGSVIEKVVLLEKLREVKAFIGFTRVTSPRDFDGPGELPEKNLAKFSRKKPEWVPASETRGEGIFIQFSEAAIQAWESKNIELNGEFEAAHQAWRKQKGLDPKGGYPGIRFVLLHSFSHALIRQLAVECGYTSSSITERIYSRGIHTEYPPMAGVLIYTSASDSEGTLGGLSALGQPDKLERHIKRALETVKLCSSDPLCAEHKVGNHDKLHGAACHACSFLPETSCERGNKYLDRAVLVPTIDQSQAAFFPAE